MSKLIIAAKGMGYEVTPEDKSLEVWGINDFFMLKPHCTMVWEMHDFSWSIEQLVRHRLAVTGGRERALDVYVKAAKQYYYFKVKAEKVNEYGLPLVTSGGVYDESNPVQGVVVPTSMEYPLAEVIHEVCNSRQYLVGTVSYMIAFALLLNKWSRIELYGCNLETDEEWGYQRPCAEWLLGKAEERGIEVDVVGSPRHLLNSPRDMLYGYINTYPGIVPVVKKKKKLKLWYPNQ
jgi:hypothetical protein